MSKSMKRLVLIGCAHSGSKFANITDLMAYVDLAKDPNTSLLILGDLFENAIPSRGEGMVWDQSLTPDDQIDEVYNVLNPVKHKIIGACTSNHSARTYKEVGIDMDKQLYKRLGVSHVYKELEGVVAFAGKKIAFAHGNGSGVNPWGDAKKLLVIYPDVDIIAVSHRHEMTAAWHGNFRTDSLGRKNKHYVLMVRTGGLMDWARYAKAELYSPQKPGFAILYFPNGEETRVDINGLPILKPLL